MPLLIRLAFWVYYTPIYHACHRAARRRHRLTTFLIDALGASADTSEDARHLTAPAQAHPAPWSKAKEPALRPSVAASTWTASGPIRIGETIDFYISVRAQERGSKVPIRIDATFTDVAGRTDRREQLNLIRVGVFTTAGTMEPKLGQVLPTEGGTENLRKLIYQYNRRLQKLQEQAALQGMSVDPSVTIEIEDINAKIAELQTKLDA